jgi:hypothetical protein
LSLVGLLPQLQLARCASCPAHPAPGCVVPLQVQHAQKGQTKALSNLRDQRLSGVLPERVITSRVLNNWRLRTWRVEIGWRCIRRLRQKILRLSERLVGSPIAS